MRTRAAKKVLEDLFDFADVRIDGHRPWDIQINNPAFYQRALGAGSMGLGESYMDEWWDCEALDQFFERILTIHLDARIRKSFNVLWAGLRCKLFNRQRSAKAFNIGKRHYDIGNDLFRIMLDKHLNYSCGYWKETTCLDAAQEAKMELICRKIGLAPGMTMVDIGCGWGGLARYAAKYKGVKVLGITVSKEQAKLAKMRCQGLDVQIALLDYRKLQGTFDRIVSVGMIEHVGERNFRTYMRIVRKCLAPDGLFLLQTIGNNKTESYLDPWFERYIFPNSILPSANQLTSAAEGLFVLEDWHSFGHDYDQTLMAWHHNFTQDWDQIKQHYDQRFFRMWSYYLLASAGSFRARRNQLWQIVYSPNGQKGGYERL
jgi:cyclopropane-fatty-acyl-phospholipid synthase